LIRSRREHLSLAVLFIDLDDFKDVNDTLGHDAGDRVLVSVAERLASSVRPGDTAARLGGDEFAVLLPAAESKATVDAIAERLQRSFEKPFPQAPNIKLTATIGTALSGPSTDPDSLLETADAAMYVAKRASRGGQG
jgi:diguanylate cyclase (GGDEF)-like protein